LHCLLEDDWDFEWDLKGDFERDFEDEELLLLLEYEDFEEDE